MRWFKHVSDAHDDEFLVSIIAEFGWQGYGWWWALLERIAGQWKPAKGGVPEARFRVTELAGFLSTKPRILRAFLSRAAHAGKMRADEVVLPAGTTVVIRCDKLLEIKDEYSKRSRHTPKQYPDNVRPIEVDVEVDVEVEEKKKSQNTTRIPRKRNPRVWPQKPDEPGIRTGKIVWLRDSEIAKLKAKFGLTRIDYIHEQVDGWAIDATDPETGTIRPDVRIPQSGGWYQFFMRTWIPRHLREYRALETSEDFPITDSKLEATHEQ